MGRFWPVIPALATLVALLAVLFINIATVVAVVDERSRQREEDLLLAAVELRLADADGRALRGFVRGRLLPPSELADMSAVVPELRSRLETGRATLSGLIRFGGLPLLVANGPFAPNTAGAIPADAPKRSLIMTRRFDSRLVAELNQSLRLEGLRLGPARGPEEAELLLRAVGGEPVATLAWRPARPGLAAVREEAATVLASLLLSLIVLGIVGRTSIDAARKLTAAALSDALSGLPNRRAFRAHVARELLSNRPICVALLDLDGFKAVNDIYGHAVGDQLLLTAARALAEIAGDGAMVARLGGDEFALATAGDAGGGQLEALVDAFIERTRQPFRVEDRTLLVGASAGLARGSIGEADAGELLRRADVALYAAKREGKGRSRWYHGELDRRQAEAHALADELRQGLAEGAFHVVYQPIVSDRAGRIAGVEALLRYAPAGRPEVAPGAFIPVAEETGLIDRIGVFAMCRACEEMRALDGLHLAVNRSAAQLRNPDLPEEIEAVLAETGFPASRLELEVTETYLVQDPELARRTLERLKTLGATLCLDDFGTGYASLGFLQKFRFDRLKIDRSLVMQATCDPAAKAMLLASLALARVLGMTVVAEGIETIEQRDAMLAAGCDLLQGWLFARELGASEVARLWRDAGGTAPPGPQLAHAVG